MIFQSIIEAFLTVRSEDVDLLSSTLSEAGINTLVWLSEDSHSGYSVYKGVVVLAEKDFPILSATVQSVGEYPHLTEVEKGSKFNVTIHPANYRNRR